MPVPSDMPPTGAAYQFIVPALAVAPSVTVPEPHRLAGVVPVIVGIVLTVALVVIVLEQVPLFTVKEYTPAIATVAFADTVGLC